MSKRSIQFQGGGERYGGGPQDEEAVDRPQHATAAQLAKRKIAQAKGSRRPRSESPLTSTGSIFEQASQSNLLNNSNNNTMSSAPNPFNSNPSFTFGTNGSANSFNSGGGSGGGSFTFGQQTQQSTPTTSSFTFGGAPASNPFSQSPAPQQNGFSAGFSFGQQQNGHSSINVFNDKPAAPAATNGGFTFGQKPAEAQPPANPFGGFSTTPAAVEKPAADGWSSFLSQKPAETPKPATNGFAPSTTSIFSQTNGDSQSNGIFAGFGQTQKTPNFNFSAQSADNDASMMSPEATPQKQNTGMFGGLDGAVKEPTQQAQPIAPVEAPKSSLFDRISRSPPKETSNLFGGALPSAAPTKNLFAQSPAPNAAQPTPAPQVTQPQASTIQTSMDKTRPEHFTGIRELNEALMQHLKTQDLSKDLSTIFKYYQSEVGKLQSAISAPSIASEPAVAPAKPTTSGFGSSVLGRPTSQAPTSGLFGTAPAAPRAEQPAYPSLPETASATSKLFQAALDKPAQTAGSSTSLFAPKTNGFTPASKPAGEPTVPSLFAAKPTEALSASSSLFASKPADAAPPSVFAPKSAATGTATPSLFAPKSADSVAKPAGFTPTAAPSSGANSFLSSFGQQAASNAEKEKKRRRDEDYDSDEETKEEWEKRDAAEQEAKRAKIENAAKTNGGFKFTPAATSTTTPSASIFGKPAEAAKKDADTASSEDHTWKQGTPIKFGGAATSATPAAAPKLGLFGSTTPANPFGSTTPSASLVSNTPKPAPAFNFGQPSSTPAPAASALQGSSTPATTSTADASASQGEDGDAAPPEPQLDDMAVLLQSEKDESDVLYHVEKSKSRKLENRVAEGGSDKMTWIDKGHGPIWILRNKTTGKTRVLQKIKDSGRAAMNFTVLAGNESLYKNEGMNGKAVMATFIDHIGDKAASRPSQWVIIVGKKEDAAEITRVLREEQKKA